MCQIIEIIHRKCPADCANKVFETTVIIPCRRPGSAMCSSYYHLVLQTFKLFQPDRCDSCAHANLNKVVKSYDKKITKYSNELKKQEAEAGFPYNSDGAFERHGYHPAGQAYEDLKGCRVGRGVELGWCADEQRLDRVWWAKVHFGVYDEVVKADLEEKLRGKFERDMEIVEKFRKIEERRRLGG